MSGATDSNECPAGSGRIDTEAACRTSAVAAGMTPGWPFVQTRSDVPRGCYYHTFGNYAYFNTHVVGAGHPTARLLCTTGARVPHRWLTQRGTLGVLQEYSQGTHMVLTGHS